MTLERAAEAVQLRLAEGDLPVGGVSVVLQGGTYHRTSTWSLGVEDSGQDGAPVTWRAAPGETVRISGAVELLAADFTPLESSDPVSQRIPPTAHDSVRVIDLAAQGITDYGTLDHRGSGGGSLLTDLELSLNGEPQHPARWPNRSQTDPVDPAADAVIKGDIFGQGTVFSYLGTDAVDSADDGYPNYGGQAEGSDWYLYHCTWDWGEATHRYWFVSASDPRVDAAC